MKKILVIDGNSIINRAYYGMRPLTTKSGKTTHAVYGMINIISRQLSAVKPDYAAVAFDLKAPTFRHQMYDGYKAGRHATPDDLISQFPDAKECLSLMGLHVLELVGYEADDIQGTVAKMAHSQPDTEAYVLSGDRDLLQLIDDKITVLLATNSDTKHMDKAAFREEYGIDSSSFVDMKALMGDSSDNIPGVAGIGKKTAQTLIESFGSLDGIYENIDDKRISKGVREKLIRDKDNAYLSRKLAEICTEAPIGKALAELERRPIDNAGLYRKFTELELNSLIVKFGLTESSEEARSETESPLLDTKSLYTDSGAEDILKNIKNRFSFEILNGIVYISSENNHFSYKGELSEIAKIFDGAEVLCYDGKALYHILRQNGCELCETKFIDLLLYSYVLNPGGGSPTAHSLATSFASKTPDTDAPCESLFNEIELEMRKNIAEIGAEKILYEIELPLVRLLGEIEEAGFKIDCDGMLEYAEALDGLAHELTGRIYMQAGREFNINSPKQLGEVLFEDLMLPCKKKKTKSGYSTDAQTLEELRSSSPIIDDILEYRQVTKLRGTYAAVLPTLTDSEGRIHTDFKQALTATGRLSSAEPNLQNIPIRTRMGRQMRRYFIAKDGYSLLDADYSQIELRLLAHISGDYTMRESFISGEDIHRRTAAAVFGIPEEQVTEEMRKSAKAVNFGIVYGIGGFSLAKDIGTSVADATRYIKSYKMNYPDIDRYLEDVVKDAERDGYTTTSFGRRRYIPEINSQNGNMRAFGRRVAMNAPIQGTAADIMKLAMLKVDSALKKAGLDARIVMQVHDELVIEVRDDEIEACREILRREMESAAKLSVPLTVDVTVGKNWLDQD
ncbi:MAG: DNA polymerase I [Clostridia bacterium]|nr:DNA polymerase I [Clostridia bacterium]